MSHLGMLVLFAACVSLVFGALLRDDPKAELQLAVRLFAGLVLGAYAVGWVMFGLFH
jgi:hypothetical protein